VNFGLSVDPIKKKMPDDVWENCARAMRSPLSRWDFDINENHISLPDGKSLI